MGSWNAHSFVKYPISLSCTSGEEKEGNDAADRLQQLAAQLEDSAQKDVWCTVAYIGVASLI